MSKTKHWIYYNSLIYKDKDKYFQIEINAQVYSIFLQIHHMSLNSKNLNKTLDLQIMLFLQKNLNKLQKLR